jgi:hypothetical protein
MDPQRHAVAWLPFFQGDITVKGRTVDIDVNPFELLEHLDAVPFMGYSEARRGPLILYNDIFLANVGIDASVSRAVRGLTVGASADVDVELAIIEVGGAFEVARWSSGGRRRPKRRPAFCALYRPRSPGRRQILAPGRGH